MKYKMFFHAALGIHLNECRREKKSNKSLFFKMRLNFYISLKSDSYRQSKYEFKLNYFYNVTEYIKGIYEFCIN